MRPSHTGRLAFAHFWYGSDITIDGSAAPGLTIDGDYDVDPAMRFARSAVESGSSAHA